MIFLYDTWFSVVLVRPKHKVKLPTQSADKWICMGKWAFEILADFFSQKQEGLRRLDFFTQCVHCHSPGKKTSPRKLFKGQRNISYTARDFQVSR